jgi:hypothetical protein
MNENKQGYWAYSIIAVLVGMGLLGFLGWLICDLINKLADKDLSNNTVIQAILTLIITVFIGGFFSKWLESRNAKKLELYKIQTTISLTLIDLASEAVHNPENEQIKQLLIRESSKVKLYFSDSTLKALNEFIKDDKKKPDKYNRIIDELRKNVK